MIKRLFDIAVSSFALLVLSPIILFISFSIKKKLGSPVFYRQVRPGKNEKLFSMIKFRTMTNDNDNEGKPLPDSERMTKLGSFLRETSLDELPELINVLKGDMSLVGPRPLLPQYLPLYSQAQRRRHLVRPGITGWAQINGRNLLSWKERFELDVWYIDNHSFFLDVKILIMTVLKVISREGISAENEATMTAFTGDNEQGDVNK